MAVVAALNDNLEIPNVAAIKNNLPEGWEVTGPTDGVYTCISPKLNKFTVGETDKKIIYAGIKNTNPENKEFYGVGYFVVIDSKKVATYYFLENNMVVGMTEADKTIGNPFLICGKFTKNGNLIEADMFDGESGVLSEDYETISEKQRLHPEHAAGASAQGSLRKGDAPWPSCLKMSAVYLRGGRC